MNTKRYFQHCLWLMLLCISSSYANTSIYATNIYPSLAYNNAFVFNPRTLSWHAYGDSGQVVNSGRASGGRGYCPDSGHRCHTPVGHFRVISKGGAGCRSTRYPIHRNGARGGSPMPYCMYFSKNFAVHGSYEVRPYNASHGCIRIEPSAARWLSSHFMRYGTSVIVLPY